MTASIFPELNQMEFFERHVNDVHPKPFNDYDPLIFRLPQMKPVTPFRMGGRLFEVDCIFVPQLCTQNGVDFLRWKYFDVRVLEAVNHAEVAAANRAPRKK